MNVPSVFYTSCKNKAEFGFTSITALLQPIIITPSSTQSILNQSSNKLDKAAFPTKLHMAWIQAMDAIQFSYNDPQLASKRQ